MYQQSEAAEKEKALMAEHQIAYSKYVADRKISPGCEDDVAREKEKLEKEADEWDQVENVCITSEDGYDSDSTLIADNSESLGKSFGYMDLDDEDIDEKAAIGTSAEAKIQDANNNNETFDKFIT